MTIEMNLKKRKMETLQGDNFCGLNPATNGKWKWRGDVDFPSHFLTFDNTLYACRYETVRASTDYGYEFSEYSKLPVGLMVDAVLTTQCGQKTVYHLISSRINDYCKEKSEIWVSEDSLKTFKLVNSDAEFGKLGVTLAVAISNSLFHVYCSSGKDGHETWISRDRGSSWVKQEVTSIMLSSVVPFGDKIYAIAVNHKSSKWDGLPLVCSTDSGNSWVSVDTVFAKNAKALIRDVTMNRLICFTDCHSFELRQGCHLWEKHPDSWVSRMPCNFPPFLDYIQIEAMSFSNGAILLIVDVRYTYPAMAALYIPEDVSIIENQKQPMQLARRLQAGNDWHCQPCVWEDLFVIGETLFSRSVYYTLWVTIEASTDYGKTCSFHSRLPYGLTNSQILPVSKDKVVYLIGGSRGDRFVGEVWVSRDLMKTFDCLTRDAKFEGRKVVASFAREDGTICAYFEKREKTDLQLWICENGIERWEKLRIDGEKPDNIDSELRNIVSFKNVLYGVSFEGEGLLISKDGGCRWRFTSQPATCIEAIVRDPMFDRLYCFANKSGMIEMFELNSRSKSSQWLLVTDWRSSFPTDLTIFPDDLNVVSAHCFASGTILLQIATADVGPILAISKPGQN